MKSKYQQHFSKKNEKTIRLVLKGEGFLGRPLKIKSKTYHAFQTKKSVSLIEVINKVISNQKASHSNERIIIRSDAITFLYINFKFMVYDPLKGSIHKDTLMNMVREDIELIVKEAMKLASKKADKEISSHQILLATGNVWNNLRTMAKDSW